MKEKTAFYYKKWFKNLKFILMTSIMIAVSLLLILEVPTYDSHPPTSDVLARPIGWIGLLFSSYALFYMLYLNFKYALKGRKMTMITKEGLVTRDEFVEWEQIVSISGNKYYVIIEVNDIQERLNRASYIKRISYRLNRRFGKNCIFISNWDYDGSQESFIDSLLKNTQTK